MHGQCAVEDLDGVPRNHSLTQRLMCCLLKLAISEGKSEAD